MSTDTTVIDKDIKTTIETTSSTNTNTKGQTMDKSTTNMAIETTETLAATLLNKAVVRPSELSDLISLFVASEFTGIDAFAANYITYTAQVAASGVEGAARHAHLMDVGVKGATPLARARKIITTSLKRLATADALKGASYIDRNVVAKQIGNKVSAKTYTNLEGELVKAGDDSKMILGLNITEFLRTEMLIHMHSKKSAEGHTIVSLDAQPLRLPKYIAEVARQVRAIRAEDKELIVAHTPTEVGGYVNNKRTMLNSKGFNAVTTQPQEVCDALNKLQDTAYAVRMDLHDDFMDNYKASDYWRDDNGRLINSEWTKVATDFSNHVDVPFHFAVANDDRGRMYSAATYVTLQGDKFQKAMLEFATKEVVTEGNIKYLKVAFANESTIGDKVSIEAAVEWFDAQSDAALDKLATANDAHPSLYTTLLDYRKAVKGEAIGTILPWDATNQGAQIYAILGRDITTAILTNVVHTGERQDAYGVMAAKLNAKLGTATFTRSNVKNAFMVFLYGAGQATILNGKDDKKAQKLSIGKYFPAGMDEDTQWSIFSEVMVEMVPAAVEIMDLINRFIIKGKTKYSWTMPDGFKVDTTVTLTREIVAEYVKLATSKTPAHLATGSIQVRREEDNGKSRALAPNIVHSIDSFIMREIVRRADFDIVTIHDSFGVHANNVDAVRELYRTVLAEVMESNLLEDILAQIDPELAAFIERKGQLVKGDLLTEQVLGSQYSLR